MPSIDFEVFCEECGEGLCNNTNVEIHGSRVRLYITPCPHCLESAKEQGFEEGYEKAQSEKEE